MYSLQFSRDGVTFFTVIRYSDLEMAESTMKALAGWSLAPYWRVREADQESDDFHAVKE